MNLAWAALGWGALLIVAFAGWGGLFLRAVLPAVRPGWGLAASVGIAVTAVLGGVANLARVVSAPALISYVMAGAIGWLWLLHRTRAERYAAGQRAWRTLRGDWLLTIMVVALLALLAIRFASAPVRSSYIANYAPMRGMSFNMHDDMHAYLVFPEKLLQTGHLGSDPFNSRQLETSLGGQHVLAALGRAVLPREHLHVVEEGVCLLILFAVLAELLGALSSPPRVTALLLLVAQWTMISNLNLSSYLSSAALVGAICWLFVAEGAERVFSVRPAVTLGLLLAGLAALKSTMIPLAALLVGGLWLGCLVRRRHPRLLVGGVVALGLCVLGLSPWMIAMEGNYGTPLFPLLGQGTHYVSGTVPLEPAFFSVGRLFLIGNRSVLVWVGAVLLVLAIAASVPALRRLISPARWVLVGAILLAWAGGATALGLAGGGIEVDRYVLPLILVAVPVLFAIGWDVTRGATAHQRIRYAAVTTWLSCVTLWVGGHSRVAWFEIVQAVSADLNPATTRVPLSGPELAVQAARVQAAVPPGEPLLARLTHPFLLDFRRNPIYVPDWPGAVSPAPGMPLFRGSEPLAKYLLAHGVRYVAYSHANAANFRFAHYAWMLDRRNPLWTREVAAMTFAFQDNLVELGITRRHVYLDAEIMVIDLATYSGRMAPLRVR